MEILKTIIPREDQLKSNLITIVRASKVPAQFDKFYLDSLGFTPSESVLYVRLFTNLGLIDISGKPTDYYEQFIQSISDSRVVISKLLHRAYSEVFDQIPLIHRLPRKIAEPMVRGMIDSGMSETYTKKILNTFFGLLRYADSQTLHKLHKKHIEREKTKDQSPQTVHEEFLIELINGFKNHAYGSSGQVPSNGRFSEIEDLVASIDSAETTGILI